MKLLSSTIAAPRTSWLAVSTGRPYAKISVSSEIQCTRPSSKELNKGPTGRMMRVVHTSHTSGTQLWDIEAHSLTQEEVESASPQKKTGSPRPPRCPTHYHSIVSLPELAAAWSKPENRALYWVKLAARYRKRAENNKCGEPW